MSRVTLAINTQEHTHRRTEKQTDRRTAFDPAIQIQLSQMAGVKTFPERGSV